MSSRAPQLPKHWVLTARVAWLLTTAFLLYCFIGGLALHYQQFIQPCVDPLCSVSLLHPIEVTLLNKMGLTLHSYAIFQMGVETLMMLFWLSLAIVIFWKQFTNAMGLVLAFLLIVGGLYALSLISQGFVQEYLPFSRLISDLPAIPILLFTFMFPNGRFVHKWPIYFALLPYFILLFLPIQGNLVSLYDAILDLIFIICLVLGLFSQFYRYRFVSTSVQRKQTRWAIYGLTALVFVVLNWIIFFEIFRPEPGSLRLFMYTVYYAFLYFLLLFFPTSLAIAIMRHRLFDIDVLIRRTLIYGLLSASLAIIYFGTIILSQTLFRRLTGQESQLVIVLSTLAIAALFTPLRRGIQKLIDRRFYRQKYNAEKVLAEFAAKARDEVELDALTKELTQVVKDTMQPVHLALWLKKDKR